MAAFGRSLAEQLGVPRQQVSRWRTGKAPIPEAQAAKMARYIHDDAGRWLVRLRLEYARDEHSANAWREVLRQIEQGGGLSSAQNVYCDSHPIGRAGPLPNVRWSRPKVSRGRQNSCKPGTGNARYWPSYAASFASFA